MRGDFQIGDYLAQPQLNRITGSDRIVHVEPKVMDVLVFLAQQKEEVVPKERLIKVVWGGTFVTDDVLKTAISVLRKAFGDDAKNPSYIETIPKRGYRLLVAPTPQEEEKPRRTRAATVAVLMSAASIAALVFWSPWTRAPTPSPARPVPLTSYPGLEGHPALSPDGTHIAFVWDGEKHDNRDIYVMLIGSAEPHRLTSDPEPDVDPTWSPDGTQIAFLRYRSKTAHDVYVIPVVGGTDTKVGEGTVGGLTGKGGLERGLSWSPVAPLLAMVDQGSPDGPDSIFLLSLETRHKSRLSFPPEGMPDIVPRFSPDGGSVGFLRHYPNRTEVCIQRVQGGQARCLPSTSTTLFLRDLDWTSDGTAIVYSRSELFVQDSHLLRVPVTGGDPQLLTVGDGAYGVSVDGADNRLVYEQVRRESDIWRVGGPNSPYETSPSRFAASSTLAEHLPEYSPDGSKIAFMSNRLGDAEIWLCDADGKDLRQLTELGFAFLGEWSPSGDRIALAASETGDSGWDILVLDDLGGPLHNLTRDPFEDACPSWSPDGRWIYYHSVRSNGSFQICKVPVEGGSSVQLTERGGHVPRVADDGQVLFWREEEIWSMPEDGGEETLVLDERLAGIFDWRPWRGNIVYINRDGVRGPSIEMFNMTTGETTEIQSLAEGTSPGLGLTVSPDGRWILYTQADYGGDLMLVDNFN